MESERWPARCADTLACAAHVMKVFSATLCGFGFSHPGVTWSAARDPSGAPRPRKEAEETMRALLAPPANLPYLYPSNRSVPTTIPRADPENNQRAYKRVAHRTSRSAPRLRPCYTPRPGQLLYSSRQSRYYTTTASSPVPDADVSRAPWSISLPRASGNPSRKGVRPAPNTSVTTTLPDPSGCHSPKFC